ncbi:hypothetical protein CYMTET_16846 [Cymbomonas tetramitiformis]|uniref:Uncharacterized protein n=1 Tax=Cymbomonas tetramitiformis TaxID=36881 RepID=A0AAE0GBS3_9CHLO|nr:hypothetical protein CYMTET_16846 [Cymbomonas tetramitiformis]
MGKVISPQFMRKKTGTYFGSTEFIEPLDPTAAQAVNTSKAFHTWFGCPEESVVSVCMDATKLSSQLQFDRRRGAVVGGTVDQGMAKLVVSDGTEYHQFLEQTTQIVEADQVNVLSMSRHRPGSCALEIALWPHRHCRSDLRKEQQGAPLQAYNGVSEFWRANKVLNAISTHHTIVSFGADAGTEGSECIKSLHSTEGTCLL